MLIPKIVKQFVLQIMVIVFFCNFVKEIDGKNRHSKLGKGYEVSPPEIRRDINKKELTLSLTDLAHVQTANKEDNQFQISKQIKPAPIEEHTTETTTSVSPILEDKLSEEGDNTTTSSNEHDDQQFKIPFGDFNSIDKKCIRKGIVYSEIINDEVIQCQKITERKCYTSQETIFETYTTKICDETYTKTCHISFLEETSNVNVEVCYTEATRLCNDEALKRRQRSFGDFESTVEDTCVDAFETVCETYNRNHVVSDDYADCKVESLDICQRDSNCPKVPKTSCTIVTKNVTKEFPESQCKKIKKTVCGPEDCPVRLLPEICRMETRKASAKLPLEQCTLNPKQECRDVSILVPSLVPVDKCLDIPKEVCLKVLVPRKIKRTSTRLLCDGSIRNTDTVYGNILVAGGHFDNSSNNKASFEIVSFNSGSCEMPSFQLTNEQVIGGLALNEVPLICDLGTVTSTKCYIFMNEMWITTDKFSETRIGSHLLSFRFKNESRESNEVLVSGGIDSNGQLLKSSEAFTNNGWKPGFLPMPVSMNGHCMAMINSSSFMVTGGNQGENARSSLTFLRTTNTTTDFPDWVNGPPMLEGRVNHQCGRIQKSNDSSDGYNVVVVGGTGSEQSVEIYDTDNNQWRHGPELPIAITGGSLVEDPNGGVLLIGGISDSLESLDTILRLSSSDINEDWVQIPNKLKTGRYGHSAFFVPNNVVNCN